jgi:hypothetical protein
MTTTLDISATDTAKMVRKAIKIAYPTAKISVVTDKYSMGAAINVTILTEMTNKQVADVTNIARQFEGATFDGTIDLKEYKVSVLDGQDVRFGADFIFTHKGF